MKIKTIIVNVGGEGYAKRFDKKVNAALAEGWELVKRTTLPGYQLNRERGTIPQFYAELVKLDEFKEPDLLEAIRSVRNFCATRVGDSPCDGCPLAWFCDSCDGKTPNEWEVPDA